GSGAGGRLRGRRPDGPVRACGRGERGRGARRREDAEGDVNAHTTHRAGQRKRSRARDTRHGSGKAAQRRLPGTVLRLAWKDGRSPATLVVMLVVSTVVFAAACGSGGESSESGSAGAIPTTTRLLEQAPAPDPVTAEGVAVTALREIFTWRPADEEHGESMRRARKYLGPSLIRTLDSA